jgi:hypothetical protein
MDEKESGVLKSTAAYPSASDGSIILVLIHHASLREIKVAELRSAAKPFRFYNGLQ